MQASVAAERGAKPGAVPGSLVYSPPATLPPPAAFVPLTEGTGTYVGTYPDNAAAGKINTTAR